MALDVKGPAPLIQVHDMNAAIAFHQRNRRVVVTLVGQQARSFSE